MLKIVAQRNPAAKITDSLCAWTLILAFCVDRSPIGVHLQSRNCFLQAEVLIMYIIELKRHRVWFRHCLITAGSHVHPWVRMRCGEGVNSNSQNDVIIRQTLFLQAQKHSDIYSFVTHMTAKRDQRPLCYKRGAFCAFDTTPPLLPTVDEGPQSQSVNGGQLQPGPWEPPVEHFNECHFLVLTATIVG